MVWGLVSSVLLLGLTRLVLRGEGRRLRDVGLQLSASSANRFMIGAGLGFAVYGLTVVADVAIAGPIQFSRVTTVDSSAVLLAVGTFLALSFMEEFGFRGYPLRSLAPALGAWKAQVIVALAFGASHLLFGWSLQAVVLGVLPSALLFGAAALAFGDIAVPIGLHAALNLARWSTGEQNTPGIWTMSVEEPSRERIAAVAPVIGIAVTALFTFALWWYGRRRADASGAAV
jgi:membrane protease YdiL (CAAX protease family)